MFGYDKLAAKNKFNRIRELTLFKMMGIGGFIGGTTGMILFNHKTQKFKYNLYFYASFLINVILAYFMIR